MTELKVGDTGTFDVGTNYVIKGGRLDGCTARVVATDLAFPTPAAALAASPPVEDDVERALAIFNGGLVNVPDATNPRGYVTKYLPKTAMIAAISASRPDLVAENKLLREAVADLLNHAQECHHETTHRGETLKTIYHDGLVHAVEFIPHPSGNE